MLKALLAAALLISLSAPANAFDISFTWAGLKRCTTGRPNTVPNPAFALKDVPPGTGYIRFKLVDKNVPGFNHGGGVVAYSGQGVIAPGAFKYKSPCPPNGTHLYEWTATAQTKKNGGALATTKAARNYPE